MYSDNAGCSFQVTQKGAKITVLKGKRGQAHLTTIYPVPKYERYEKYDYSYTSDNSPVSRAHFKNIANIILRVKRFF